MMPIVSIILPTYNGEKFLGDAIESILQQTMTDWELIVVNDCSTDSSKSIVEKYALNDPRIKLINNKENKKLPEALNIGFENAIGKYLTWTSDDNYYLPHAIERMMNYLSEHDDDKMVCAHMNIIDVNSGEEWPAVPYSDELMRYRNCVGACFLYRREVLDRIGKYDVNMFLTEDYDFWIRILQEYGHIGFLGETCYKYRIHKDNLSTTKKTEWKKMEFLRREKYIEWILRDGISKDMAFQIYYEMVAFGVVSKKAKDLFVKAAPELEQENQLLEEKKIMIYGAGVYGDLAYDVVGQNVVGFIDGDLKKDGQIKHGLKIVYKDSIKGVEDVQILIAVSEEKIFSVVQELNVLGIFKWSVFQKQR